MKHGGVDRSNIIAFTGLAFLERVERRPVRLMLELMKPDILQREAGEAWRHIVDHHAARGAG